MKQPLPLKAHVLKSWSLSVTAVERALGHKGSGLSDSGLLGWSHNSVVLGFVLFGGRRSL